MTEYSFRKPGDGSPKSTGAVLLGIDGKSPIKSIALLQGRGTVRNDEEIKKSPARRNAQGLTVGMGLLLVHRLAEGNHFARVVLAAENAAQPLRRVQHSVLAQVGISGRHPDVLVAEQFLDGEQRGSVFNEQ